MKSVYEALNAASQLSDERFEFQIEEGANIQQSNVGHDIFPYGFVSRGGFWSNNSTWNAYVSITEEQIQYDFLTDKMESKPVIVPPLDESWLKVGPVLGFNSPYYSAFIFEKERHNQRDKRSEYMVRIIDYSNNRTFDTILNAAILLKVENVKILTPQVILPVNHEELFILQINSYERGATKARSNKKIHLFLLSDREWHLLASVDSNSHNTLNSKILTIGDSKKFYFQIESAPSKKITHVVPIDNSDSNISVHEGDLDFAIDSNGQAIWRSETNSQGAVTYTPLSDVGQSLLQLLSPNASESISVLHFNPSGNGIVLRANGSSKKRVLHVVNLKQETALALPESVYNNCNPAKEF